MKEIIKFIHSEEAAENAEQISDNIFKRKDAFDNFGGDILRLDVVTSVVNTLFKSGLCKSKTEAKKAIANNAISIDYGFGSGKRKIKDKYTVISKDVILWFGKKKCVKIIMEV